MERTECNLRYIYAKLPFANKKEIDLISGFMRGLHITGWNDEEWKREIPPATHKRNSTQGSGADALLLFFISLCIRGLTQTSWIFGAFHRNCP